MLIFGREVTSDFATASRREWLLTDGLGGWASGTVSGANTRRYHGLFVPALAPPVGRTMLVTKLNEWVTVGEHRFPLSCNEYADGTVHPAGFKHLESFRLEEGLPVWTYSFGDVQIQKWIWLGRGNPAAYVTYRLQRGIRPITLEVIPMVTARDAHGETNGAGWAPDVAAVADGACINAWAHTFWIKASAGSYKPGGQWHWNIKHRVETERGLPDREDQFAAGKFTVTLEAGNPMGQDSRGAITFAMTLEGAPPPEQFPSPASVPAPNASATGRHRRKDLTRPDTARTSGEVPEWIRQLARAADQFLVRRDTRCNQEQRVPGTTVLAGYHWFGEWGRDTMIALPGLCLTTGRYREAASILRTWAKFASQGMLPNRFPEEGKSPEYHSADATLWYFYALDRYVEATGDPTLARELWHLLEEIIDWHWRGTRYTIHVDPTDGLLYAGEPGLALTWMDAKVGDWVVTPRTGKPVSVNALWVNALRVMARLASRLATTATHDYARLAERAVASFDLYWNPKAGCLFDVIDGPDGNDPAVRPNQLFAVSLPYAPLDATNPRAKAVVDVCTEQLLTSYGLRSLAPNHRAYIGTCSGGVVARDSAYHQGTVWAWLIGPFVDAHYRVYRDAAQALSFLLPFEQHLADFGLGSIAEIFDGDPPHTPRGCIAQAWSVAEVLRTWISLQAEFAERSPSTRFERTRASGRNLGSVTKRPIRH